MLQVNCRPTGSPWHRRGKASMCASVWVMDCVDVVFWPCELMARCHCHLACSESAARPAVFPLIRDMRLTYWRRVSSSQPCITHMQTPFFLQTTGQWNALLISLSKRVKMEPLSNGFCLNTTCLCFIFTVQRLWPATAHCCRSWALQGVLLVVLCCTTNSI